MDDQTKIAEQNGAPKASRKDLATDLGEFAQDIVTLAELQGQLLVTDIQEYGQLIRIPGLVLICGLALGIACFPIGLTSLAFLLIEYFETSNSVGFSLAFVIGTVVTALTCCFGWMQVRKRAAVLQRSQKELLQNLRWIKKVFDKNRNTRLNSNDNSWRTTK